MSADARLWVDTSDVWVGQQHGWRWAAVHDGRCKQALGIHQPAPLESVLIAVEECMGTTMRWVPEPHALHGLVLSGWTW